ncbi:putative effector 16 [Ophiostoma piceae UAMH 11346]|uniref:Putative effector 16 n=1 Tax=Ophiostoma piceae (strain UAMH 11346) TaxID=1262450 RepID=S3C5K8_OPHP1|nr:putative effector 16 [Ophiostoma piceae UAMH 11346]
MLFIIALLPVLVAASPTLILGGGTTTLSPDGTNGGGSPGTPGSGSGYADEPSPDQIQIASINFSGNGCPQGSVSTSISPDRTVVTFGFDQFQTYIGPGYDLGDKSKNCQLHLSLTYPGGFQYAVLDSTYHGFAQLDAGVNSTFYTSYYFSQDASATTTTRATISGGGAWADGQVYTKNDQIETASVVYAPCGASGILNVNNRIVLTSASKTATGQVTDDDATVAFTHQMHLAWRECK